VELNVRRVLLVGAESRLGRRLSDYLLERPEVDGVTGVELSGRSRSGAFVRLGAHALDHHGLVGLLREREIDTVIYGSLAADRAGTAVAPSGADVVGTMRLCAAVGDLSVPVRCLVIASSSDVYPTTSHVPLLRRESSAVEGAAGSPTESLLEAEEYARDTAERAPHLCVSLLRLAELVGPAVRGPLSSLLAQKWVPSLLGTDAPVQLLHVDDAVQALAFAAQVELAGVYNLASRGHVYWSEAMRALSRRAPPLLPFEAGSFEPVLRAFGLPHVPNGMLGLLRFGRVLDTTKLASAGFAPKFDQTACLESLAARS
jgi:UDP-glucose 4-epimerase